jgi:uncharacterized membrane protein YidH (DUF202 family)
MGDAARPTTAPFPDADRPGNWYRSGRGHCCHSCVHRSEVALRVFGTNADVKVGAVTSDKVRDPSLARERTELAWYRSGLAILVVVAVMLRYLWPLHSSQLVLILALVAFFGCTGWIVAMRLARRGAAAGRQADSLRLHQNAALTLGTIAVATAGTILGFVSPN